MTNIDSDILSIQEARILLEKSQKQVDYMASMDLETQDFIINLISQELKIRTSTLAKKELEILERGNQRDNKNLLEIAINKLKKDYLDRSFFGSIENNYELIKKYSFPKGIVISILPEQLLVTTAIQNIFCAIKAGCPIILVPPKKASGLIKEILLAIELSLKKNYLNADMILSLNNVDELGIKYLLEDEKTAFVIDNSLDTKFEKYYKEKDTFKSYIGNNPVFIEKTCNCDKAAQDIIESKSFMNGLLPGSEQALVVDKNIEASFRKSLIDYGGYFLNRDEAENLSKILYTKEGRFKDVFKGKSAGYIANAAGIEIGSDVRILIVEEDYVSMYSKFLNIKPSPILLYYIEDDWKDGCEKCIELILGQEGGNSLSIYSNDYEVIDQFIMLKPVARILVNTSSGFGSVGINTNFEFTLSLTNESNLNRLEPNLNPNHLIKTRFIAYETDISMYSQPISDGQPTTDSNDVNVEQILNKILKYIETQK